MGFARADPELCFQNWKIHAVNDLRLRRRSLRAVKFPLNFVASSLVGIYSKRTNRSFLWGQCGSPQYRMGTLPGPPVLVFRQLSAVNSPGRSCAIGAVTFQIPIY